MNTLRLRFGAMALALVALFFSCLSPVSQLNLGKSSLPALKAGETRLVFKTSARSATLADANYLTVQLRLGDSVKFGSATKAGDGTYAVVLSGLIAGDWSIRAMLYDNDVNQGLLFYALKTFYVAPGSSTSVPLDLYEPGTINGVTVDYAIVATSVELKDGDAVAYPSAGTPKLLPVGTSWKLEAVLWGLGGTSVLATDTSVNWSTSDSTVATVSSTGLVRVLKEGPVAITAKGGAPENAGVSETYYISGVPGVYGTWLFNLGASPMGPGVTMVYRFQANNTFEEYIWNNNTLQVDEAIQGTYSFQDGTLSMLAVDEFEVATGTWPGYSGPGALMSVPASVGANSMFWDMYMSPAKVGQLPSIVSRTAIRGSMGGSLTWSFSRVTSEVPLASVAGPYGEGATIPLSLNQQVISLGNFAATPSDATVKGVYWLPTAGTPLHFDWMSGSWVANAATAGAGELKGYAIDTNVVVATYLVTVDTIAPTLSYTLTPVPSALGSSPGVVQVTDAGSGVASVDIFTTDEYGTPTTPNYVTNVIPSGPNWSFDIDLTLIASWSGYLKFVVTDNAGNTYQQADLFTGS